MKLISVIVPIYNAEKFINVCIEHLLMQSYHDFEIICVNDGSTDNTKFVLESLKEKDYRIKVFNQSNAGASMARNRGIREASGEYLTFIDADDYVDQDFLHTLVNNINDRDVLISGYNKVTISNHKLLYSVIPDDNMWARFKYVSTCSKLYKTSFLKEHNIFFKKLPIAEDVYFSLNCFTIQEVKVGVLNYAGYNYCLNPTSTTQNLQAIKENNDNKLLEVLQDMYDSFDFSNYPYKLVSYFYLKTVVQYLLMQARIYEQKYLVDEYKKAFTFLRENNLLNSCFNKFEDFKINICVITFYLCYKLRVMPVLLFLLRKIKLKII